VIELHEFVRADAVAAQSKSGASIDPKTETETEEASGNSKWQRQVATASGNSKCQQQVATASGNNKWQQQRADHIIGLVAATTMATATRTYAFSHKHCHAEDMKINEKRKPFVTPS
jgi:hypothetical protein